MLSHSFEKYRNSPAAAAAEPTIEQSKEMMIIILFCFLSFLENGDQKDLLPFRAPLVLCCVRFFTLYYESTTYRVDIKLNDPVFSLSRHGSIISTTRA